MNYVAASQPVMAVDEHQGRGHVLVAAPIPRDDRITLDEPVSFKPLDLHSLQRFETSSPWRTSRHARWGVGFQFRKYQLIRSIKDMFHDVPEPDRSAKNVQVVTDLYATTARFGRGIRLPGRLPRNAAGTAPIVRTVASPATRPCGPPFSS